MKSPLPLLPAVSRQLWQRFGAVLLTSVALGSVVLIALVTLAWRDVSANSQRRLRFDPPHQVGQTHSPALTQSQVSSAKTAPTASLAKGTTRARAVPFGIVTVTNGNDTGAGSLRDAISTALANDTIVFSGVTTVTLTSAELLINKALTIEGGSSGVTITRAGATQFRIFNVQSGPVTFNKLTISNGSVPLQAGGIQITGAGDLTMMDCTVTGNASPQAAGIQNNGTLVMTNCTISNNVTPGLGGALAMFGSSTSNLTNCTLSNNQAGSGAGIHTAGGTSLTLTNCTVAFNTATGSGGGIQVSGTSTLLKNTIISNNQAASASQIDGLVSTASSFNMLGSGGNGGLSNGVNGNIVNAFFSSLAPLGNYGGPTQTIALLPGSPAINSGTATGAPATDQRGITRAQQTAVDMGAFESRGFTLTIASGNNQSTFTNTTFASPLSVSVVSNFSEPVDGGLVGWQSPTSGPSCSTANFISFITGGIATSGTVTANSIVGGPYTVTALTTGVAANASFSLTNLNSAPTFTPASALSRQQGSPASTITVGTVSDAQTGAGSLTVTQIAGGTATGITVQNIINTDGTITAQVAAGCTATSGTVRFQVSDGSLMGTGELQVNVTANSTPTLEYATPQSVSAAGSLTVNPNAGPSDNGTVASITLFSQGTYTGTISVDNSTGAVSLSNANPVGSHTITIHATDNCGATTNTTFTLNVTNTAPTFTPAAAISRMQASPAGAAVTVGTVTDASTPAANLTATQIAGGSATGITVTGITNTNGTITAMVSASCTATAGTVRFQVSDGDLTSTGDLQINITPNTAPTLAYAAVDIGAGGSTTNNPTSATDNGNIVSYALQAQGAYTGTLTVNPTTGAVSISNASPAGAHSITIRATDDCNATTDASFILTVDCPAVSVSPINSTLPPGTAGSNYSQTFTASGGAAPYSFSLSAGSLPANLTLNGNGTLAGAPTSFGLFNFTVKATDANSCFGERAYSLRICPIITLAPTNLPLAITGVPYSETLTASGGVAPYTFAITGGALPTGLSLNANGTLSGTPTQPGNFGFNFTVTATDANGCAGTQSYVLTVNCPSITLDQVSLANGFVGIPYSQTLTASGGTAPYTFSVLLGPLPQGLSLSSNGTISGTPTVQTSLDVTFRVTDANGCTGNRNYFIHISGDGLMFYPLPAPVRLLDTRPGASPNACTQPNAPIAGGASLTQFGRGLCTIPASARALTGNVTTVQSGGGFLTLYPSDATQPTVANTNYGANEIINNVFTVGLGADGVFKIFALNTTDVVVDVTGYYAPPTAGGLFFHPLPAPVRLLETRAGLTGCVTPSAPLAGNTESTQQAVSACTGIPSAARALVGNATTVNPQGGGFLTLFPADATRPLVAASNFNNGQIVNGPFSVGLTPTGQFKIYTTSTTDLVVDVLGYYSDQLFDTNGRGLLLTPLAHPVRLLETRAGLPVGCFKPGAPLAGGVETVQPAWGMCDGLTIPTNARGLVGNATVVLPQGPGFLTLWPNTATRPLVATANYNLGDIRNRHFIVGLDNGEGSFKIYTHVTSDLVIDLAGYFAP